uniref:Uncharacterized protein n=1 Tax=Theropithecus gelada TaxID=9565 RepID=A0A8D2F8I7_THEGE
MLATPCPVLHEALAVCGTPCPYPRAAGSIGFSLHQPCPQGSGKSSTAFFPLLQRPGREVEAH